MEISLFPLDGIPTNQAATANGRVVAVLFAERRRIQLISAVDGSVQTQLDIGEIEQPLSIVPVSGENNGFLVCSSNPFGLSWFVCHHHLEGVARSLEKPIHLRALRNVTGLVPDPFGLYVAFSTTANSVVIFDAAFELRRTAIARADKDLELPMAVALCPSSGRLAVGQQNGVVKLYQLLQTRETIEVGICNWT